MSLTALLITLAVFGILAVKHWKRTIGAGPTILIVGAIVVSLFGALKWATYQEAARDYDTCEVRVERTVDAYNFNKALVDTITAEDPSTRVNLYAIMVPPMTMDECPPEPTFFKSFSQ